MFSLALRQRLEAQSHYCLPPESGAKHTQATPARQPLRGGNFISQWRILSAQRCSRARNFIPLPPYRRLVAWQFLPAGDRLNGNREGDLNDDYAPAKLVARA